MASMAILGLVPLLTYFLVRPHVGSDTVALGIAWLIPVVKTLVSSLVQRRVDIVGLAGVALYGIAVFVSVAFGAGSLPLELHSTVALVIIGVVCLASVALDRPALTLLLRFYASRGLTSAETATSLSHQMLKHLTLLVGIACIVDTALQVALALTLPTGQFLIARSVIHATTLIGIVGVASVLWHRHPHHPRPAS